MGFSPWDPTMLLRRACLALTLLALHALAQEPTPTIQSSTQLVVVDVIVQDRDGKPVHGLTADSFHLAEGHTPQKLRNFEEHSTLTPPEHPPEPLILPAGTFTDYTPIPPSGALNILLIDALNTPTKDQSYVRNQLKDYVAKARPGTRIAIFGLASQLIMLQGFTADPSMLKDAVEHRLLPRASNLLDDPSGTHVNAETLSDQATDQAESAPPGQNATLTQMAANLAQFEAEATSFQTTLRTQYTLDAFNTLAHYLAAFPGRKNLLWFSGAFPINILPDGSLQDPFAVMTNNSQEFQDTVTLLGKAQVAVYPIDARGLMTNPVFDAANGNQGYGRNPQRIQRDIAKFNSSQIDEHSTMDQLADETGGHAFYNTNGIADAVARAVDSGANYYTLTYTPTEHHTEGSYHAIHLDLAGPNTGNLKLSYRHGYYSDTRRLTAAFADTDVSKPAGMTDAEHAASAYKHAAMAHGGPTPQDILFKVRVLPSSTATETTLAPGNTADPSGGLIAPYQRLAVDFVTLPSQFTLLPQPNGKHSGGMEFLAYVYNAKGRLLDIAERTVTLNLSPDNYQRYLKSTIQLHLDLDTPARMESYIRIAVRDAATNRFGVVELPASTISHLPPAVYPSATPTPATAPPSTPQPATPTPSTTAPPPSTTPR